MKILFVSEDPVPSSNRISRADKIALPLLKKGHEITVLCPRPTIGKDMENSEYRGMDIKYYMENPNQTKVSDRFRSLRLINRELKKILKGDRFDVIRAPKLVPGYVSVKSRHDCPDKDYRSVFCPLLWLPPNCVSWYN